MKTEVKVEKYTQSDLLYLGLTKSLINKFLPEPELKCNPFYNNAPDMKLWVKDEVEQIMETEEFKLAYEKTKARRERAKKHVYNTILSGYKETLDKANEEIEKISVKRIDLKQLEELVIDDNYERISQKAGYYIYESEFYYTDETLLRWTVNYIRHDLTDYDDVLFEEKDNRFNKSFYYKYRKAVYLKIKEAYPEYAEEVDRQMGY